MTSRPEPRILKLAKELGTEVVHLEELPEAARREMLAERFVPGHDIDELVDQIAARAGGNAFFIQELLDTLIERGILVADAETASTRACCAGSSATRRSTCRRRSRT